jgi:hypothetical protein
MTALGRGGVKTQCNGWGAMIAMACGARHEAIHRRPVSRSANYRAVCPAWTRFFIRATRRARLHDYQPALAAVARTGRRPIRPGAESHRPMRRMTPCSARLGRVSHAST